LAKRGRKGKGDLEAVAAVEELPQRPAPPTSLSAAAKALWISVVSCYPANHFLPADLPLLASFCEHAAQLDKLEARLAKDGPLLKSEGRWYAHPGINVRATIIKGMTTLATKLRLPPNARFRRDGQGSEPAPPRKRPWEA
jgi:P27 family predicted phage terminase small subunit